MKFLNGQPVAACLAAALPPYDFYADVIKMVNYGTYTDPNRGTTISTRQEVELNFDGLRTRVMTDPAGLQEVRVDVTLDLSVSGGNSNLPIAVVPAGSKVKLAAFKILTAVTSVTGTSLGIGLEGSAPHSLLAGAANLAAAYQIGNVPGDAASLNASQVTYSLCCLLTGTLETATVGIVRCILVYETPPTL